MSNPLIRKLDVAVGLIAEDRETLARLTSRSRIVGARQDFAQEGERPEDVHLVLGGFACRYKLMADGRRHIMALLVPGDFCDLHVAILGEMDHSIATVTPCQVVDISRHDILQLTEKHPRIARALWWATLVDEGTLREWLVNLGQREADQRLGHLFCELLLRLQTVGLATETSYEMPLTQAELGDMMGLSAVHVNRTLQGLREAGLIVLKGKRMEILDVKRLKAFSGFNPNYLHLEPRLSGDSSIRLEA